MIETIKDPTISPQCSTGHIVNLKGTPLQQLYNEIFKVQHSNKNWGVETLSMLDGARKDHNS